MNRQERAVTFAASTVTPQVIGAFPQLVAAAKPPRRDLPYHDQALRRLRPLRRRRERIARPFLVFMRARKPWFFLRRRLLG